MQNPLNRFTMRFDPEGMNLHLESEENKTSGLNSYWRTTRMGTSESLASAPPGKVRRGIDPSRIEIHRPGLIEWFVNRAEGVEHGYEVPFPPASSRPGTGLRIELEISGDLAPSQRESGKSLVLQSREGKSTLHYDHLKVWDAAGTYLAAELRVEESRVIFLVDDASAAYPITIDPVLTQDHYVKASNPELADLFGFSAAVSGDTAIVGAYAEDSSTTGVNTTPNNTAQTSGAAYVFVRNGDSWIEQAYLKPSNTGAGDRFGWSVAIDGDIAVVGAWREDSATMGVNTTPNENASNSGAAYIFIRNGTTWTESAYLKSFNTGADDFFGNSVAVSGETVVVGASYEDSGTTGVNTTPDDMVENSGAVYVFVRDGQDWVQQAYLKPSNTAIGIEFGCSVAISGDTLVAGALREDSLFGDSGAAYIFVRDGKDWTQQAYLKASNHGSGDHFGWGVSISGETVAVGAYNEDGSLPGVNPGDDNGAIDSGAVYVFTRDAATWTEQARIKASNPGANDQFGWSVAVSGDYLLVGSPNEDSGTSTTNSTPDESASNAGAAYLYHRVGGVWSQHSYLKALNSDSEDNFGWSVAVDSGAFFVGAIKEDGGTPGVDATPDESQTDSGAAYLFGLHEPAKPSLTGPKRFPVTKVGSKSRAKIFSLANKGEFPFSMLNPRVAGSNRRDFRIVPPAGKTISGGSSIPLRATFKPRAAGRRIASLRITTNAGTVTAPLKGLGK